MNVEKFWGEYISLQAERKRRQEIIEECGSKTKRCVKCGVKFQMHTFSCDLSDYKDYEEVFYTDDEDEDSDTEEIDYACRSVVRSLFSPDDGELHVHVIYNT